MSKRNPGLPRNPRDLYNTPEKATIPALRHLLLDGRAFLEPCSGEGKLISHLCKYGFHCAQASDIASGTDAMSITRADIDPHIHFICTNPPWDRDILHPMIDHLVSLGLPVWLLLDADWMHTKQARPHLASCSKIVSIGRVRWMEGTHMDGYDNAAWYRFHKNHAGPAQFFARI